MSARNGPRNHNWIGGVSITEKGYKRIYTVKGRKKYEHRYKIEILLENPIGLMFSRDGKIPKNMDVHHIDYDRQHNCYGNLMLLQKCIHNSLSRAYRDYVFSHMEEYQRKVTEENMPEWVKS